MTRVLIVAQAEGLSTRAYRAGSRKLRVRFWPSRTVTADALVPEPGASARDNGPREVGAGTGQQPRAAYAFRRSESRPASSLSRRQADAGKMPSRRLGRSGSVGSRRLP